MEGNTTGARLYVVVFQRDDNFEVEFTTHRSWNAPAVCMAGICWRDGLKHGIQYCRSPSNAWVWNVQKGQTTLIPRIFAIQQAGKNYDMKLQMCTCEATNYHHNICTIMHVHWHGHCLSIVECVVRNCRIVACMEVDVHFLNQLWSNWRWGLRFWNSKSTSSPFHLWNSIRCRILWKLWRM